MSELVAHLRTMRDGTGETDVSLTKGPVSVAVDELVRDITERCGHTVRMGARTWRLGSGEVVRQEFEVDVTLEPDAHHDEARTFTWDEVVTRLSEPFPRMRETREAKR